MSLKRTKENRKCRSRWDRTHLFPGGNDENMLIGSLHSFVREGIVKCRAQPLTNIDFSVALSLHIRKRCICNRNSGKTPSTPRDNARIVLFHLKMYSFRCHSRLLGTGTIRFHRWFALILCDIHKLRFRGAFARFTPTNTNETPSKEIC